MKNDIYKSKYVNPIPLYPTSSPNTVYRYPDSVPIMPNSAPQMPMTGPNNIDDGFINMQMCSDEKIIESININKSKIYKVSGLSPDTIIINTFVHGNDPSEILYVKDGLLLRKIVSTNYFGYKPKSNLKKPDATGAPSSNNIKNIGDLEKENFIKHEIMNLAKCIVFIDEKDIIDTFSSRKIKFMVMSPIKAFIESYYENINSLEDLQHVFSETYVYNYFYSDDYVITVSHGYSYPNSEEIFISKNTSISLIDDVAVYSDGKVDILNPSEFSIMESKDRKRPPRLTTEEHEKLKKKLNSK